MKDNSKPILAKIVARKVENFETTCFRLKFEPKIQNNFQFLAGQFLMVGIPGFGEAAFTLSSDPKESTEYFEICVRRVGELTNKINEQKRGDILMIRGPYGNGFPKVDKNLILIGGGCGFIPLKSVLLDNLGRKDIAMQVFNGCKSTKTLLFEDSYNDWKKNAQLNIILEETAYLGEKGFVTDLIKKNKLLNNPLVFVCGPEIMYKFVVRELLAQNINPKNIYFSLERRMYCGQGVCQHCAIGEKYVCKDGPVFSYEFLKTLEKHDFDL